MSLKNRRRTYAGFRRRRRPVACGRTYHFTADLSQQFGLSTIGVQAITIEPDLMGDPDKPLTGAGSQVYIGSVPQMFDRALFEMVASDPQKGIFVPGVYNKLIPVDTKIGHTEEGTSVDVKTNNPDTGYVILSGGTSNTIATGDDYVFTPLNSWKYYPQSVWMKFKHTIRRTFYNPTNTVQTVFVTELRRRRSQLACAQADGVPANTETDYELVDIQPYNEEARLRYDHISGDGSYLLYIPETLGTSGTELIKIMECGEMYKKFLYIRFGQYEAMQLQSRGLANIASQQNALVPPQFRTMGRWQPRLSFNPVGAEVTDPHNPSTHGYSHQQNIRDPSSTTVDGLVVQGAADPWLVSSSGTAAGSATPQDYRYDVTFNPLKNPFLKKLFYMKRTKYVLAPGGTATHVYRTSGNVNPLKSRLIRQMRFYSLFGSEDGGSVADTTREFPYVLPFPSTYTPAPYAHATRKTAGFTSVGSIVQVKGQMVFNNPEASVSQVMQFGPTRVVAHDKHYTTFRACSYGRPSVGGTRRHTTFLSVSNTATDYRSMNPTAPPQAVNPDRSAAAATAPLPVSIAGVGTSAQTSSSLSVAITSPIGTGTAATGVRTVLGT